MAIASIDTTAMRVKHSKDRTLCSSARRRSHRNIPTLPIESHDGRILRSGKRVMAVGDRRTKSTRPAKFRHSLRLRGIVDDSTSKPIVNLQESLQKTRRRSSRDPRLPKRKPKKPERPPRPPPRTHLTCRICTEDLPIHTFIPYVSPRSYDKYQLETPAYCISHLAYNPWKKLDPVCRSCIGLAMAARHKLVGARRVSTGCLEPGCEVTWDFDSIMRFFPKGEALEKYNIDMLQVYVKQAKLVKCVNEQCGTMGFLDHFTAGYPQIQCRNAECNIRYCAKCLVPWHTDLTCAEYFVQHVDSKMNDSEKETLKLMQEKDSKRCPNCFIVIEKDGGCNSMYCESCKTFFDWATAASAVPGATKAQPVNPHGMYYANTTVPIGCEMDALAGKDTEGVGRAGTAGVATAA